MDEVDDYSMALKLEETYIAKFDTYNNGLNLTPSGNKLGPGEKFNTFGHVFSEKTKANMQKNHWSKTGSYNQSGRKLSEEAKDKIRNSMLGKCHFQRKITKIDVEYILNAFNKNLIKFSPDYLRKFVTLSQKPMVETLSFSELKSQNGKPITLEKLYSEYFAEYFEVTPNAIRAILNGKNTRSI